MCYPGTQTVLTNISIHMTTNNSTHNYNSWTLRQKLIVASGVFLAYWYSNAVQHGVQITTQRTIACSSARAFAAVTDFEVMPQISEDILGYEFPDDSHNKKPEMYLGMEFRERRRMGTNTPLVTNLRVTEFRTQDESSSSEARHPHARMVADTHGTIWDTTFDVYPTSHASSRNEVILKLSMHARAHEWVPKLINPIMQVLFRYGLNKHMDLVKVWCEEP